MTLLQDKNFIEKYKVRSTIKRLQSLKGSGTSMITLILKAGQQLDLTKKMLTEELSTSSNIKSGVNRKSVQSGITSAIERLKLYSSTPKNGLVLFSGYCLEENKERKITIDFEPFKPLTSQLYYCDSRFHTEILSELLEDSDKYGYVIISGTEALIGTVCGSNTEVLRTFSVELPKKHHKGGQSAMRYSRLRIEKRAAFVRKTIETVNKLFIESDGSRTKLKGLIAAGPASLKSDFAEDSTLDTRLKKILMKVVDTAQGGNEGFREAVEMTSSILKGIKLGEENECVLELLEEVRRGSGLACIGSRNVCRAIEESAVKMIILYEEVDEFRCLMKEDGETVERFYKGEDLQLSRCNYKGEVVEKERIVDFVVESVRGSDCDLVFISDKTPRGKQFIKTFGGVGAVLKYKIEMEEGDDSDSYSDYE